MCEHELLEKNTNVIAKGKLGKNSNLTINTSNNETVVKNNYCALNEKKNRCIFSKKDDGNCILSKKNRCKTKSKNQ